MVALSKESIESELTDLTTAGRMIGISRQAISQHVQKGRLEIVRPGCAALVWVGQVKKLHSMQTRSARDVDSMQRRIQSARDKVSVLRDERNKEIDDIREEYRDKIASVRDANRRKLLRNEKSQKIRESRRGCRQKVEAIMKSIQVG